MLTDYHPIIFRCPVCFLPLEQASSAYLCPNNHLYDVAKHGYVNLILANQKNSKEPGDNLDMVRSRQRFLNAGYYTDLADLIAKEVDPASSLLDIGCGEGFYLHQIQQKTNCIGAGIDISKQAVRLAAQRNMKVKLAVANAFQLPFFDATFDVACCVFAPLNPSEAARVVRQGGRVILVGPGKSHLESLAAMIYQTVVPHRGNYQNMLEDGRFRLAKEQEMRRTVSLGHPELDDLLAMTPYGWQISSEQKISLQSLDRLETTFHFVVQTYERN